MKKRHIFAILFIAAAVSAAAQSREDIRIYIPLVVAVEPAQAEFFQKNFAMEIASAGYTVTENVLEADYSMRLRVRANVVVYSDGTSEPAPPDEHQYVLQISLIRNSDNSQVVSLTHGFSQLEEMYNHNLPLIYQILANVPLVKGDGDKTLVKFMVGQNGERIDWWRNKWLYFRISADFPISYYQLKSDGLFRNNFVYKGDITAPDRYSRASHQVVAMPGVTLGFEFQFLNWMSLEVNGELRIWDAAGFAIMPGVGAQLKFPFKPSAHYMIEPYAAGVYGFNLADHSIEYPQYSVGGGIQFGVKSGDAGILFFDANYMQPLDEFVTRHSDDYFPKPDELHWKRFVIGLSLGIKLGVGNRGGKQEENSTWMFK